MDKQKVINALKELKNYCLSIEHCGECDFFNSNSCEISTCIGCYWSPSVFEIEKLEEFENKRIENREDK